MMYSELDYNLKENGTDIELTIKFKSYDTKERRDQINKALEILSK